MLGWISPSDVEKSDLIDGNDQVVDNTVTDQLGESHETKQDQPKMTG